MATRSPRPLTRMGWYKFYVNEFNRTGRIQAAHLACWFLVLHLEFGD